MQGTLFLHMNDYYFRTHFCLLYLCFYRVSETYDGSPTKRRLVRNQSEGSPKMGEHLDIRKMSTDGGNPSLRKRVEYGIIGDATCMGDHKVKSLCILKN